MNVRVVIPIKAPAHCKTRLRDALGDRERRLLVADMLRHVVDVAAAVPGVDELFIVGPSRHGLPLTIGLLDDPGAGLNAALQAAARTSFAAGVDRVVCLAADLPLIDRDDIVALIATGDCNGVAIAPDRSRTGTNALALPAVDALRFAFSFGPGSFDLHFKEAGRLGLPVRVVHSPTLALDVDLPADLEMLPSRMTHGGGMRISA